MWKLLFLAFFFPPQSALCDSEIEMEVMQQLNMLEDRVYQPIGLYQSILTEQFETIAANFTNYRDEANSIVDSYTQSIIEDAETVLENFRNYGVDTTTCAENVQESIDQLAKSGAKDIQDVILKGVTDGRKIVTEAKNVFAVAQNQTVAIRLVVQNCISLLDSSQCLLAALDMILFMQHTISPVLTTVGAQHETQLGLLEESLVSGLETIVIRLVENYTEILDGILICTLQYYTTD